MAKGGDVEDGNKLIAEFMGIEYGDGITPHYHFNWNELMPVVEKINLLDDYRYTVLIGSMDTQIVNNITNDVIVEVSFKYSVDELIESVYDAVVEFIKQKKEDPNFAKGGMTQGYNARMDESLGMRHRGSKMQSLKSRRDEAKGMNKAMGNRAYQSVGTMDKMAMGGSLGNINQSYNIQEGLISVGNNVKMKKGGRLYDNLDIKKGTFTKKAKNRGMTTKAFMKEVLANPEKYTMKTRRQAQLMKNMQ